MRYGYARISTDDQNLDWQRVALGCSTGEVIMFMDELTKRGIVLRIFAMPALDIRSDDGRLIADTMALFAAHEHRRTNRRQEQGIAAAKAAGRHLGRPRKLNGLQIAEAHARIAADESARVVARAYGIDVKTLQVTLKQN